MVTTVLLVRHAKPEEEGQDPPLSQEGRKVQQQMAQELVRRGYAPKRILSSPKLRAQQTAEILSHHLGGATQVEPALGSSFDEAQLLQRILPGETTLLVGHDPTLAQFANLLLGERVFTGLVRSCAIVVAFEEGASFGEGRVADTLIPKH